MFGGESTALFRVAAAAADVVRADGGGAVGGTEEVDLVLEEGYDGGGFEEPFHVIFGAFDVAFFVSDVAFVEVGFPGGRGCGIREDREEVGPGEVCLVVGGTCGGGRLCCCCHCYAIAIGDLRGRAGIRGPGDEGDAHQRNCREMRF